MGSTSRVRGLFPGSYSKTHDYCTTTGISPLDLLCDQLVDIQFNIAQAYAQAHRVPLTPGHLTTAPSS